MVFRVRYGVPMARQSSTASRARGRAGATLYCPLVKGLARVLVVLGGCALLLFVASRTILPRLFATHRAASHSEGEPLGTPLPDLSVVPGWINGDRAIADSLRGHPIVVALWSDTDPECLRALPMLESWHQAYRRYGARIIGVHEPDFAFAADAQVPTRVARRLGLNFPIALDSAGAIRQTLGAPSDGPRIVLADSSGTIVATASGNGQMAVIEQALRAQFRHLHPELDFPSDPGLAHAPSTPGPGAGTPAVRVVPLGVTRVREGPLAGATPGRSQSFTAEFRYQVEGRPYVPYPVGLWTPGGDGATAARGGAENFVALRYDAGALWAVLGAPRGEPVRVWVLSDEQWLTADALGADARRDARGASYVDVTEPRLYALCRERAGNHVVKLSPGAPGLTVYALIVEPADVVTGQDH